MVVPGVEGGDNEEVKCFMGTECQCEKLKRVLETGGADGCITM